MEKYRRYISVLILAYVNHEVKEDNKAALKIEPSKPPDNEKESAAVVVMIDLSRVYRKYII